MQKNKDNDQWEYEHKFVKENDTDWVELEIKISSGKVRLPVTQQGKMKALRRAEGAAMSLITQAIMVEQEENEAEK